MSSWRKPAGRQEEALRRPGSVPVILVTAALVLAFLVHVTALWFPFVDDDEPQIVLNSHVQAWHFLPRYFTADVWSQTGCGSNYFRPIFLLWLRLNHSVFGLNPMGWHVAALLLHVLAAFLVYLLAARELKDRIAAGFAATIFAVHPITVESVAWVSGATEALEGVLFLGCLLCYRKGSRWSLAACPGLPRAGCRPEAGHRKLWQAAALLLFALALLAKETAVALPLLVLIYEFKFQGFKVSKFQSLGGPRTAALGRETGDEGRETANGGTLLRAVAPYAVILVAYLAIRAIVLHGMATGRKYASTTTTIATWPAVLWFYVHKLAVPWPLSLNYSLRFATRIGLRGFWLPSVALLAVGSGLWIWFRRDRRVAMPCAWFLVPLLPAVAATLRFDRGQLVHDRYLYLPLAGFSMLCALALRQIPPSVGGRFTFPVFRFTLERRDPALTRNVKRETKNDSLTDDRLEDAGLRLPAVQTVALLVVLGIFGITTAIYIGNWSSNLAIYSRAVAVAPDNAYAHNSLAEQLFNHMRFNDALSQFRQALAADPENTQARTSLGQSYGFFGQWADAARQLRVAAQLAPTACAFTALAEAQRKAGQLPEAEASYRHALALPSCPPHTHWAMAEMLRQEGKLAEARAEYQAEQAESPAPDVQQHIDELDRLLRTPLSR